MSNIQLSFDFRSDTFTQPSEEMRQFMASAPVGDDVFGEDESVNALEIQAAQLLGKEASLFVPSGCMGNLIALMGHADPGQLLIAGGLSHIHQYELGSYARIAGLSMMAVDDANGWIEPNELERRWPGSEYYLPQVGVIVVENTHNVGGGLIYPVDALIALSEFAKNRQVPIHLDGARLLHASVACGLDVSAWTEHVESVMMCFSKGLGAPVGSILAGDTNFIAKARVHRKLLGGGMRQAGILAAACSYALKHHVEDLARDHERCALVHRSLQDLDWMVLTPPATNILMLRLVEPCAKELAKDLAHRGLGVLALASDLLRLVFHRNLCDEAVAKVIKAVQEFGVR